MHFIKNYIRSNDWIAKWYIVSKERGSNTHAIISRRNDKTKRLEENSFCHSKHDGMGYMLSFFKKENIKLTKNLDAKFHEKVSFFKNFHKIFKGLTQVQKNIIPWKTLSLLNAKSISPVREIIFFTPEETKAIHSHLKNKNYSENAYILSVINNLLMPELKSDNSEGKWLFPINMRGNVHRNNIEQNISSGIYISTNNLTSPGEIKTKIKKGFLNNEHWINWWCFHISIFLSKNLMRKISKKSSVNSFFYGSFSNMGHWGESDFEDSKDLADYSYYVSPPGTPNYPISVGVITWFGKLSISLKIHPSILVEQSKVTHYSAQIKNLILSF